MASRILVDPSKLEKSGNKMREQAAEYGRLYLTLFTLVDNLSSEWKGEDNEAFSKRILDFKNDLDTMKANLDKYADFLNSSATLYKNTQTNVVNTAKGLAN
jgi:Uncharacterized protein conserved in bacteria